MPRPCLAGERKAPLKNYADLASTSQETQGMPRTSNNSSNSNSNSNINGHSNKSNSSSNWFLAVRSLSDRCLPVASPLCPSVCPSVWLADWLSVCQFVCLSVCLSASIWLRLSICLLLESQMEPRSPKWSPGDPNGAQEAHSQHRTLAQAQKKMESQSLDSKIVNPTVKQSHTNRVTNSLENKYKNNVRISKQNSHWIQEPLNSRQTCTALNPKRITVLNAACLSVCGEITRFPGISRGAFGTPLLLLLLLLLLTNLVEKTRRLWT